MISNGQVAAGVVGTNYSQTLAVTGGTAPYSFSVIAGTLPQGLSLSTIGAICGVPSVSQTANFTVQVTDSKGASSTTTFNLIIYPSGTPIVGTSSPLPSGTVGVSYSQTLTATGGATPYVWSIASGTLPLGLSLSAAGVISGSPTTTGTVNFIVQVTGNDGLASTAPLSVSVNPAPTPPTITTPSPLLSGTVGSPYTQTLTASGGVTPYTWSINQSLPPGGGQGGVVPNQYSFLAGSLPDGLSLSSSGIISGTPTATGTASFTVLVTGGNGLSSSQTFSLTINPPGTLVNGSFETGNFSGWTVTDIPTPFVGLQVRANGYSPGYGLFANVATDGTYSAISGFDGSGPGTIQMAQDVSVSAAYPYLAFDYRAGWDMLSYSGSTQARTFAVTVQPAGGGSPLLNSIQLTAQPHTKTLDTGAISGVVNLSAYAGTTVRVCFVLNVPQSFTGPGYFELDNVRFAASIPPSITTASPLAAGSVGAAYNQALAATGGTAPYSWTIASGSLPSGLSLTTAGVITGTPSAAMTASFTAKVTDANGASNTKTFGLTITQPVPVITSPLVATATKGSAFSYQITATQSPTSFGANVFPVGLSINTVTGVLSGIPTVTGTFQTTISATNSGGTGSAILALTVQAAPSITNGPPPPSATTGFAYNFAYAATGFPAPTFSVTSGSLPPGIVLSANGVLSGTPTQAGYYSGTVDAGNGVGTDATQNFSISVQQPASPVITNGPPPATASLNGAYSFTYTATGFPAPTFAVTSGSLPPGVRLSSGGALAGTPSQTGIYAGTVTASNGVSPVATQNFTIVVYQAPTFTNPPLSLLLPVNTPSSFTFTATGYPAPTFVVNSGSLPPGMTLSSTGALSGTPTQSGNFTGTVTATNAVGSASQNFSITVAGSLNLIVTLPGTVNESDPDGQGTLGVNYAPVSNLTVQLTSSNTGALTVPTSVTIPAGQTSVALPYTIVDNLSVYGTQTSTVVASTAGWNSASGVMTVQDNKTTDNWSSYGNNQAHTGVYLGPLLGGTYSQLWSATFPSGTNALNQVIIAKGVAYATPISRFSTAALTALDASNGSRLWQYVFTTADKTFNSINPPTIYKGNVYVQQGQGLSSGGSSTVPPALWSFNSATGQVNWTAPFTAQWESYLAPTIYQSIGVWVDGGTYSGLYGFNFDGSQRSYTSEPQYDQWTPTYYNGMIYTWVGGTFSAVNPATGVVSWSVAAPYSWSGWSMNCAAPIANNLAFLNGNQYLTAVNVGTHATAWTLSGSFKGTPAVGNTSLYVISGSQVLILNANTGATVGVLQTSDSGLVGQPVVATDSLLVSSATNTYLFNLQTGALVQTIPFGGPVSVANGTLYLAGSDGTLRSYLATPTAPRITSSNSATFTVGLAGSFTVTATGSPAPTFSAAGLPSWTNLNSTTGLLSGTPPAVGTFTGTITAGNGTAPDATQNFSITVLQPPSITNGPPPAATLRAPYNFAYTSSGTPLPSFSVTAGSLPTGLTLSSSGVISGTPTLTGTFTGTVTASNGVGAGATQIFSIPVLPIVPVTPVIATEPPFTNGTSNTIAWAGVSGAAQYDVQASTSPTFSTVMDSGWITDTSYTFTGLAFGTTYYYRVRSSSASAPDGSWTQLLPTDFTTDTLSSVQIGNGTIYVPDSHNHTLRKITAAGVVTTVAGVALTPGSADGTGAAARFNFPQGAAVDNNGNIYVADEGNDTVRKITPTGTVITFAGQAGVVGSTDGTGSAARFNNVWDARVDATGNVYVADRNNNTIRKITPAGTVTTLAGAPGIAGSADGTGSAARFNGPAGLALDNAGNIFVADTSNSTIRKITPAGVVTTLAGLVGSFTSADGSGTAARFNNPAGLVVDGNDTLYITDNGNHTIRKCTSTGTVTTLAGLAGNSGTANGTGSAARFTSPYGIAFNTDGNLLVADVSQTIRRVTLGGVVTTLAGLAGTVGSADGTVTAARFNDPSGIALDGSGGIILSTNGTTFSPSGSLLTNTIAPGPLMSWGILSYSSDTSVSGTGLTVDVLNSSGSLLASNVISGTDLSTLPAVTNATGIQLRANFSSSISTATPRLNSWSVSYYTSASVSPWSVTATSTQGTLPTITSNPPPAQISAGSTFSFTFKATGFPPPTFTLTSGTLPPGLTLASNGVLSGTPTTAGTYSGTVTASNGISSNSLGYNTGTTTTQDFTITIENTTFSSDSPVMPPWALAFLAFLLVAVASKILSKPLDFKGN